MMQSLPISKKSLPGEKPPGIIVYPPEQIPGFRAEWAKRMGTSRNILIKTWGGIGDQICAEPTLRWAINTLNKRGKCKITLHSELPELFAHLKFDDIFTFKNTQPIWDDYYVFDTIAPNPEESLVWQFFCHTITHCVDFPTLSAFRFTLPVAEKEILLKPKMPDNPHLLKLAEDKEEFVLVHAGAHWDTKTYPIWWWDGVIDSIRTQGLTPVLVGKKDNRHGGGYIEHKTDGCVDLRDKTTIMESVWLSQQLPVVFCNDSSVLHMAASGRAFIGFVATAKHPDYIMHWRNGQWAWRQKDFGLGGMWDITDNFPDGEETVQIDKVDQETLLKWLPDPSIIGLWCKEKRDEYFKSI